MSDGTRYAPEGRIYGIYGATVFGMQAVERTLKVALIETIIIELGQLTSEMKRSLEYMTLGNMIEKLESLVQPRFTDECGNLRNYVTWAAAMSNREHRVTRIQQWLKHRLQFSWLSPR